MTVLSLPDVRLNFQHVGTGTPVTMVHGLGANMAFWYFGPGRLMTQDNRLLMYDLRGHGVSTMPDAGYTLERMVEDLLALLDDQAIEKTHLIGHSYGARVALAFAARYPERLHTLTVADTQIRALQPPMRLGDWPHWKQWKADLLAGGQVQLPGDDELIDFRLLADLGQAMGKPAAGLGGGLAGGLAGGRAGGPGALAGPRAGLKGGGLQAAGLHAGGARGGPREAMTAAGAGDAAPAKRRINLNSRVMGNKGRQRWVKLLEDTSADVELHDESLLSETALQGIEVPTMLMYGSLSHCLPTSDILQDLLPDSRRVVVSGAGHFFPIVKPKMFARAYGQFLHIAGERRRSGLSLRKRRHMQRVRAGLNGQRPMNMGQTS